MAKSSIERVLLAHLEAGERERFTLPAYAHAALERTIARVMDGTVAAQEIRRALQLVTAFDKELESPAIAATLVELLRAHPRARALAATFGRRPAIDATRSFRRSEGREEPLAAPRIDERPPATSVRLARIDPRATHLR